MITWREKKFVVMIILVMAIGCVSIAIFWSLEDSGEEFSKSHSGSCLVKQIWSPERVSRSAIEPARNSPFEVDQGRDTRNLAFHMGRLLEYMFLDGQPKPVMMPGQHGDVPVHQDSRKQQDSFARQASSTLDDAFCSRLSYVILVLLLLHSTPLTAMAHRLKTMKYTNFFESEKDKILNAKVFKLLSSPFTSLGRVNCAVTDWHSKDRKKHDWLEDPLRWTEQFTEYTTFTVLERIASYRPFAFDLTPSVPSTLALADAGFLYPGVGATVLCQGCRSVVDIKSFNSPPTEARYHRERCSFVAASSYVRGHEGAYSTEDIDTDSAEGKEETAIAATTTNDRVPSRCSDTSNASPRTLKAAMAKEQSNNQRNEDPDITEILENSPACPETTANHVPGAVSSIENQYDLAESEEQHSEQAATAAGTMNTNFTAPWECKQIIQDPTSSRQQILENVTRESERRHQVPAGIQQQQNEDVTRASEQIQQVSAEAPLQATPASATMGACANPGSSEQSDPILGAAIRDLLFDPNVFEAEAQPMPSGGPDPRETCQKNPGHYGSFPMWQLQLDHIPSNVRCPEMLELVQLLGKLVVKLTIKTTSRDRPHYDERTETQVRCGTGMAFVKDDSEDLAPMEPSKKWNTIRRYLPGFKKNKGFIYIQTNYHLVFDTFEAENTMVEFFYDNPNSKEIVRAKGVSVTHSSTVGDLTSYLKCKISDLSMVDFVKNTENEVKALVARLPERIKGNLMKRVFVISHPHGLEKAFSYGEHALVKYTLKMEKNGQEMKPLIAKVNNHTQISTNSGHIRKVLFYTADTCKGSSGGVVVSFKKTTLNGTEDIELDLWMHSCVEKKHGLNASVMKELTPDDVSNHGHTTINRPSIQDEQEAEADAAAGQRVTGPVYTVIGPPAHPVYVPYMKRLDSYPTPFNHVHTAADLADAGFFFAGYADCVRCFQCGLGLRSWKAGDIIYEEHNRNRPDCPFLQVKMRANGIHMLGFQSGNRRNNSRNSGQDQTAPQCGGGGHQNQQHNMPMAMDGNSENSPGEGNETQVLKPHNGSVANAQREPANVLTCSNDQDSSDVLKSTAVVVLEREQKYLKQIFTCKVCYQKPVKDLFLPCGELIACLDCSKLLTHCPSCNKKILATVTTYFS